MRRRLPFVGLALALVAACASLDHVNEGQCGNGVVEPHEDCDTFAAADGTPCRKAGSDGQCRLDCSANGNCPTGWGCGKDGICRQPTGAFADSAALATAVNKVVVGDLDGDKRADVVSLTAPGPDATSKARVHFVGADGKPDGSLELGRIGSPSIVGYGGARALLANVVGAVYFTVSDKREVLPVLNPTLIVEGAQRAFPVFFDPTIPAVAGAAQTVGQTYYVDVVANETVLEDTRNNVAGIFARLGKVEPKDVRFLSGRPGKPLQLVKSASVCGDVLVWGAGGHSITLASPCAFVKDANGDVRVQYEAAKLPAPKTIDLPADVAIDHVVVGDVNGDGKLEVYASAHPTVAGPSRVFGAYLDPLGVPVVAELTSTDEGRQLFGQGVLSLADIDGDGLADIVTPQLVLLSRRTQGSVGDAGAPADAGSGSPPLILPGYAKINGAWAEAVSGDFNGDGRVDVVARVAGQADLELVTVNGVGVTVTTIKTEGAPTTLATGDFDGDGVADVAYAEPAPAIGKAPGSRVRIVYGDRSGVFGQTATLGLVSNLVSLIDFGAVTGTIFGATDDLGITSIGTDDDGKVRTRASFVLGSADRLPVAPVSLTTTIPAAVFSGFFRTKDATDIVELPFRAGPCDCDGEYANPMKKLSCVRGPFIAPQAPATSNQPGSEYCSPQLVPWENQADPAPIRLFGSPRDVDCSKAQDFVPVFEFDSVRVASGDVDGDGVDEGVLVTSYNTQPPGQPVKLGAAKIYLVRKGPAALNGDCRQIPATAPSTKTKLLETTLLATLGQPVERDGDVALVDVDGDGKRDIVAVQGTSADTKEVVVLFNEGGSRFGLPTVIAPKASAFTFARVLPNAAPSLVVATAQSGGYVLQRLDVKGRSSQPVTIDAGRVLKSVTALAAGDVDGDGVDDLVVVDGGEARVLVGKAKQ